MKLPPFLCLLVAFGGSLAPLTAQVPEDVTQEGAPAGSTVITSDELHSDQTTHVSIFTGNVIVVGTNFNMTCQEMTVNFTKDNKIDNIVAVGDVVITQPDRITHCGRAQYFHDDDKFILTESPVILDHKNQIEGPRITIFRTTQKMIVDGGRSKTIIANQSMGSSPVPSTQAK